VCGLCWGTRCCLSGLARRGSCEPLPQVCHCRGERRLAGDCWLTAEWRLFFGRPLYAIGMIDNPIGVNQGGGGQISPQSPKIFNRKGRRDRRGEQDSSSKPKISTAPPGAFRFRGCVIHPPLACSAISAVDYFGSGFTSGLAEAMRRSA
jgi:hypothetical protein